MNKKIAFIYIAEPYQCYHAASIANFLDNYPDFTVSAYYSFYESFEQLSFIKTLFSKENNIEIKPFKKRFISKFLHLTRRLDREKEYVFKDNIHELNKYDAIIATENTASILKNFGLSRPKLIFIEHGAGDRKVKDEYLVKDFDFALFSGPKRKNYFVDMGYANSKNSITIGYPKFDIFDQIRKNKKPFFKDDKPVILYNPHYKKSQTSYYKWGSHLINLFKNQQKYNLVVAPHVKMFHEGYFINEYFLKQKATENIRIDTGSMHSLNMTYTANSSIYIGDVSSQIYEFIIEPRPCIFLNPHKIKWQNDPYFKHWHLGEVIDDMNDIMPAIQRAHEKHHLYRDIQIQMARETFGDLPLLGASQRAAEAIRSYLDQIGS